MSGVQIVEPAAPIGFSEFAAAVPTSQQIDLQDSPPVLGQLSRKQRGHAATLVELFRKRMDVQNSSSHFGTADWRMKDTKPLTRLDRKIERLDNAFSQLLIP
jgi:hypothetical protein